MAENAGTETAGRVADVLLLFTEGPCGLGVSKIARRLGLSKTVVHRILRTLVDRGMLTVEQETRRYLLGPATAALGVRALGESELRLAALPVIRELARCSGETTTLSALIPDGWVYLDEVPGSQAITQTVELGRRFPLYAGSSGKCMVAFLPAEQREAVIAGDLPMVADRTVVDRGELRATLASIRGDGYTWSTDEREIGAGSIAAPMFSVVGEVVGALSICASLSRFDSVARERYVPVIAAAADEVSRMLGWRGGLPNEADRRVS